MLSQKKDLKRSLQRQVVPVRQAHLRETQALARKALYRRAKKQRLSFWHFLGTQVRFIGWKVWLSQAVTLLFLCWAPLLLWGRIGGSPRSAGMLLCGCSLLIFMTALPFLHRSKHFGMCEVEMAAKFSGVKQLAAKLMIIGIGDITMLSSIFCFVMNKTALDPGSVLVSLLLPFLAASCGLLYLIGHTPGSKLVHNSVVICALLFLGFTLLANASLFRATLSWAVVCIGLAICCICQTRSVFLHSSYEEIQLL